MIIIKIIIIIFIIIGFFIVIRKQIENFNNNTYINSNKYNTNFNKIYSCLPYDIKVKNENSLMYDYGNDELNDKFSIIFNLNNPEKQIKYIEGFKWSNWKNPDDLSYLSSLNTYYKRIINEFEINLNNELLKLTNFKNDNNFKIIDKSLNKYKKCLNNGNIYMLDIDLIIHRNNKPLGRHIKIIGICSPLKTEFIFCKVIGVINENDLFKDKVISASLNNNYTEFIPERVILYDNNSFIYDLDERRANAQVNYNIYNKLLKDLIT